MVEFADGPAGGVVLMLRRAPRFLRVVRNPRARKSQWDALDQLDDTPKPHEELSAYRIDGAVKFMHLKMSPRSSSGYYAMARYVAVEPQPGDATMRDTAKWRAWCLTQDAAVAESKSE